MKKTEFQELVSRGTVLLDGATGSCLKAKGMPSNVCVEDWICSNPELLMELQKEYKEAGSQIVYAPTFSANSISLKKHGLENEVERLNTGLVEISRKAVGEGVLVAGDLTTTGELLEPLGDMEEEELFDVYCQQIRALAAAGADLLVAETMLCVAETEVAVKAAAACCDLPIMCTLTVSENGRALFGGTAVEAVETLQELGAAAVGVNCSVGPEQLVNIVADMKAVAKVPVIAKPNAGLPKNASDGSVYYDMQPEEFASHVDKLITSGAEIIGGCCGTGPAYIRELAKLLGR
ncbi:MAG: homocysteine S-methyltransferase family protein [Lachnospiraceae bacterium]|nr:homocysteine S-methyltransferase family protein [Lachnospiraceae bacterium]